MFQMHKCPTMDLIEYIYHHDIYLNMIFFCVGVLVFKVAGYDNYKTIYQLIIAAFFV